MTRINRAADLDADYDLPERARRCRRQVPSAAKGEVRRHRIEGGRQHAIKIRLSDIEYEALIRRALASHVSVQHYLVGAALAHRPHAPQQLTAELVAIRRLTANLANNINQIARKLNSGGTLDGSIRPALDATVRATRRLDAALSWLGQLGRTTPIARSTQPAPRPRGPDPPQVGSLRINAGSSRTAPATDAP